MPASSFSVRPYLPADEPSWLRCRLLGFFDTDYFDDVWTTRPTSDLPIIGLVAIAEEMVVGILDIEIDGGLATIDTVAVHPDFRHRGIATTLLDRALSELPAHVDTLDAWTREDVAANSWYRRRGFVEDHRYLHVYKAHDEPADGFTSPDGLSAPVTAFLHARIEDEARMRARFRRVHICRRYVRDLR